MSLLNRSNGLPQTAPYIDQERLTRRLLLVLYGAVHQAQGVTEIEPQGAADWCRFSGGR
ncbi:MAG TPA: hypothetical protein VLA19_29780 [Herpetosiphonaceae bacterium]|nr:hypothetical protein [Herpetosiphonaceae bacterium]